MSKLDDLYRLRERVDQAIGAEVARLEEHARREHQRFVDLKRNGMRARCGTDSGYYSHVRYRKEAACEPCKQAHREAESRRRNRREQAVPPLRLVRGEGA
jgi:hypothetical protein